MDFGVVENLVSVASNNGGSLASETGAEFSKLRLYGSASLNRDNTSAEDDLPPAKSARISSGGGEMAKFSPRGSNNGGGVLTQQTSSFFPPDSLMFSKTAFPFVRSSSGYGGVRNPFTPSQWMELEHQALIYKYITANVPIPSYLLIPIKKAMESCGMPCFSLLNGGWSGFHLGFSKSDPEPGRCRRTDGKKWRCSREAVADQKYCERHMNRGRHRSRKPVEGQAGHFPKTTSTSALLVAAGAAWPASKSFTLPKLNQTPPKRRAERGIADGYTEFGSVSSDSLLNPLSTGYDEDERKPHNPLRQFIDEWPKNPKHEKLAEYLSLSRDFGTAQMGQSVAVAALPLEQSHRHNVPVSYDGPLGEALHTGSECKNTKWENRGGFGSGGDGSKKLDRGGLCNGLIGTGMMLPSLPAL